MSSLKLFYYLSPPPPKKKNPVILESVHFQSVVHVTIQNKLECLSAASLSGFDTRVKGLHLTANSKIMGSNLAYTR